MINNFNRSLIGILKLNLALLILFAGWTSKVLAADPVLWPPELTMTHRIFAPYLTTRYSDIQGLVRSRKQADDLQHYLLMEPIGNWKIAQSCNQPARKPGYIHTTKYTNEMDSYEAKIAVPIMLELNTSFLGPKKEHLLNSTLLTVIVFGLDGDDGDDVHEGLTQQEIDQNGETGTYELVALQKFDFTIKQLCSLSDACVAALNRPNIPVHLSLNQPILTGSFRIDDGRNPYVQDPVSGILNMVNKGKIRIRVEWSFQGICDEDEFRFKIGDQIRILKP